GRGPDRGGRRRGGRTAPERARTGRRLLVGPRRPRNVGGVRAGRRVSRLVVIDADVLGRHRTGDETYVQNLLRRLPALASDEFRFAALTRRPDLVPEGVEAVEVPARFQELRMIWGVPRTL